MNKRLEYIDLAKGIGIIFIIAYHLRILPTYLPHLSGACVPLFFILSGLFFNESDKFKLFVTKKVNTILIPFLFFYIVSYIAFYIVESWSPGLLSLFWDFIILWIVFNVVQSNFLRFICVSAITFIGLMLSRYNVFLPLKLAPAFSCSMFLYFGTVFKRCGALNIVSKKLSLEFAIGFFSIAVGLNYFFAPVYLELYNNTIVGNAIVNYLIVISFTLGVIYLCKTIGHLPLFSYFGKYSIIPLCLHHIVYRPILLVCNTFPYPVINNRITVTIMTIIIIWILMPVCLKLIPWFCGKKPMIRFEYA